MRTVGRHVITTTAALSLGFLTMLVSDFQNIANIDISNPSATAFRGDVAPSAFKTKDQATAGIGSSLVRNAQPVPEPSAAVAFVVGFLVVGTAVRKSARR